MEPTGTPYDGAIRQVYTLVMGRLSILPVETRPRMTLEEARWAAFLDVADIPFQYKPLQFAEADTGATANNHIPSFLLQYENPLWLEVLPVLSTAVLPAYDEVLHFARTVLLVDEHEESEYWPVSVDCVFVAFGRPGLPQGPYSGTYPILVLGSKENPEPLSGSTVGYAWGTCRFCQRVTLCADFGGDLGDVSCSVRMSCCGHVFDGAARPLRNSQRLRHAIAAAGRVRKS